MADEGVGAMTGADAGPIGFVGLGNVGGPMAANLLGAGFDVVGFDPRPNPAFEAAGGRAAASLEALAGECRTVLHSLPSRAAIDASIDALLARPVEGRTLVELSSYALDDKLAAAERLAAAGATMLDCEVSGLPPMVAARKAVIFKSGDAGAVDALAPVFDAVAERHFHLGDFGAATVMKLVANTMVCVHNLMAAEALNLGRRAGLDPALMVEVLGPSAAGSSTFGFKAPLMVGREFDAGAGPFSHMFGYLERAESLARSHGAATPLLGATREVYARAEAEGRHGQDIAAIIEIVESLGEG